MMRRLRVGTGCRLPVCLVLLALLAWGRTASADSLAVPTVMDRTGTASAIYEIDQPGGGVLRFEWTDGLGRVADRREIKVGLLQRRVIIPLDLRRAVAMRNTLLAHLDRAGKPGEAVQASFVARPAADPWDSYQILMWQNHTPAQYRTLRGIGVSGAMLYAKSGEIDPAGLAARLDGDMPFYLENIATDLLAPYHMASSEARFQATVKQYLQDPSSTAAFIRDPSLSDPHWLDRLQARLRTTAASMSTYRPLFYNLGDETGIADIAAAWDFDLSAPSLAGMRTWLASVYPSLDALNAEWGTQFASWAAVTPMLTADALKRSDDNLAAWGDFKAWMDLAYANALQVGTDALHKADPTAVSAIEGVQVAGWGGYDLGRVPRTVDLMEFYNVGGNIAISHAINPNLIVLSTSFADSDRELHRLWREILLGARGHVIWDDGPAFLDGDTGIGPRGRVAERYYPELRGGVTAQVIASKAADDGVGVLYSQASFRTQWLLDARTDPKPWTDHRTPGDDNGAWRQSLNRVIDTLAHIGVQPRFLSSDLLEQGVPVGIRLLVLPHSVAMSVRETNAVRAFVGRGGQVLALGEPALFDEHSRRLPQSGLAAVHGRMLFPADLQTDTPAATRQASFIRVLQGAGIVPFAAVTHPDGTPVTDVVISHLSNGSVTLIGLQRDISTDPAAEPVVMTAQAGAIVTDLRAHRALAKGRNWAITLDPTLPTVLALSPGAWPALRLKGPTHARAGEVIQVSLSLEGRTPAAQPVVQVELLDPQQKPVAVIGRDLRLRRGRAVWTIPFAVSDTAGRWTLRATDILSGAVISQPIDLTAP